MIYENDGYIKSDIEVIAYQLGDSTELVKDVITDCFNLTDDGMVTHNTIIEQLEVREEKYKESVEKGTKGANKRWGKDSSTMEQLSSKYSSTMGSGIEAPMGFDARDESREMRDESREIRDESYKEGVVANSLEALKLDPETPSFKRLSINQIEKQYPDWNHLQVSTFYNSQPLTRK
jgi:hypothetical protein